MNNFKSYEEFIKTRLNESFVSSKLGSFIKQVKMHSKNFDADKKWLGMLYFNSNEKMPAHDVTDEQVEVFNRRDDLRHYVEGLKNTDAAILYFNGSELFAYNLKGMLKNGVWLRERPREGELFAVVLPIAGQKYDQGKGFNASANDHFNKHYKWSDRDMGSEFRERKEYNDADDNTRKAHDEFYDKKTNWKDRDEYLKSVYTRK